MDDNFRKKRSKQATKSGAFAEPQTAELRRAGVIDNRPPLKIKMIMADLLVVGRLPEETNIAYANGYRGVERDYINFPTEFYETAPDIMELYKIYDEYTDKEVYIHNMDFATTLKDIYNKYYPNKNREVIEVVSIGQKPEWGSEFLGYDIVDRAQSNIMGIILPWGKSARPAEAEKFRLLLWAISTSVINNLNKNELFDNVDIAQIALSMIDEISFLFKKPKNHHFSLKSIYLCN